LQKAYKRHAQAVARTNSAGIAPIFIDQQQMLSGRNAHPTSAVFRQSLGERRGWLEKEHQHGLSLIPGSPRDMLETPAISALLAIRRGRIGAL
jgi:hypothetical protein